MNKAELAFERLLRAYGKKRNVWARNKQGGLSARVGSWTLDNSYGGYKVAEITNKSGGERDLFDMKRRKSAEFARWVDVTIQALRQKKK